MKKGSILSLKPGFSVFLSTYQNFSDKTLRRTRKFVVDGVEVSVTTSKIISDDEKKDEEMRFLRYVGDLIIPWQLSHFSFTLNERHGLLCSQDTVNTGLGLIYFCFMFQFLLFKSSCSLGIQSLEIRTVIGKSVIWSLV